MTIPRAIVVLFTAIAVTGSGLAQDKAARKKLKLVPVQPVAKVQQGFKNLVFPVAKQIVFQDVVFTQGLTNGGFHAFKSQSNPLMQGEYKTALQAFDRVRTGLSMPRDSKTARGLLDDLDLKLIAVRRALWEAERRARTAKVSRRLVLETLNLAAPAEEFRITFERLQVFGRGFNAGRLIQIDGKWIIDDGKNPFVRGDYRKAVVALTKTRTSLNIVSAPKAARRIVDTLNRMLLDVRRELWKIEQARKKK